MHKRRKAAVCIGAAVLTAFSALPAAAKYVDVETPLTDIEANIAEPQTTASSNRNYRRLYTAPNWARVTTYSASSSNRKVTRQVVTFWLEGRERNAFAVLPWQVYGPWTKTGAVYTYVDDAARRRYPRQGYLTLNQECRKENEHPGLYNEYRTGMQVRTYLIATDGSIIRRSKSTSYSGVLKGQKIDCVPDGR